MGIIFEWLGSNWFSLLQTTGIVAGLCFTGRTVLLDSKIRKVSNLLNITQQHRSIWQEVFDRPKLLRILSKEVDLKKTPISLEERVFVNFIILHLTAVMTAIRGGVHQKPFGQDEDLRELFSLPIPNRIWNDSKKFREPEVVGYIESLLAKQQKPGGRMNRKRKIRSRRNLLTFLGIQ